MNKNFLKIEGMIDGKEINLPKVELSEETVRNIVGQLGGQEAGFERVVDQIRVSSYYKTPHEGDYPIRISIPNTNFGLPQGMFGKQKRYMNKKYLCAGQILTIDNTRLLIKALEKALEVVENA